MQVTADLQLTRYCTHAHPLHARLCPHAGGASCGHNQVRHLQHAQLQKVHGEEYDAAHQLYQQRREQGPATAGSSSGRTTARRLHASTAAAQPTTRLQKLLQENQASTLRIQPVFQLQGGSLTAQQAAQVKDVLVPGAIKVLQQYVKVGWDT